MGEIDWDSCPSNNARNLLVRIKDPRNRSFADKFFNELLTKFTPKGSELEEMEKHIDDGRKLDTMLEKISKAAELAKTRAEKKERDRAAKMTIQDRITAAAAN